MILHLVNRLNKLIAHLEAHGAFEEVRILTSVIPSFFRRNYDYDGDYQNRVKRILRKKKRRTHASDNEGPFRRKEYNLDTENEETQEFIRDVTGPQPKRRRKRSRQPSARDLSDRFKDHTVDSDNMTSIMHDTQHNDSAKPSQHSIDIAI